MTIYIGSSYGPYAGQVFETSTEVASQYEHPFTTLMRVGRTPLNAKAYDEMLAVQAEWAKQARVLP